MPPQSIPYTSQGEAKSRQAFDAERLEPPPGPQAEKTLPYTSMQSLPKGGMRGVPAPEQDALEKAENSKRDELWRGRRELRAAGWFLERAFPRRNVMLTAELHGKPERDARDFCRGVLGRFGELQKRSGLPRWHFAVAESTAGYHVHGVGPLSWERCQELLGYSFEGVPFAARVNFRRVIPQEGGMIGLVGHGLLAGYLGEELTTAQLCDLGGERLHISKALEKILVDAGQIEPRRRVYASRAAQHVVVVENAPTPAAEPSTPVLKIVVDNATPAPTATQLDMFFSAKPVARLRHYAHGIMPPAVALEVETRRKWLGMTQAAVADAIGLSRPQLVNVLHGVFPMSAWAATRLRNFMLRGEKIAA